MIRVIAPVVSFQTSRAIMSRVTTSFLCRSRYSSNSNSRPVSSSVDPGPRHPPGEQVHLQVVGPQDQLPLGEVAAQQGAEPGEQLGEGERLDQVVVGAAVQALDPLLDRVAGP